MSPPACLLLLFSDLVCN